MELVKALKTAMADVVTFYFMAHGYHWNVEGQDFSQYHSLFADIYEDAYGSLDPLAENIRKLDDYAPFSLQKFIDLRTVEFKDVDPTPKAMAKSLLKANETVLETIGAAFKAADSADEQGIANFLAERIDMHNKWAWQLRASTK
jgi:starvation-inducible DNA-binding protein